MAQAELKITEKYRAWHEKHQPLVNKATLIISKQRHGSTGNIPLKFQAEITKFSVLLLMNTPPTKNIDPYYTHLSSC